MSTSWQWDLALLVQYSSSSLLDLEVSASWLAQCIVHIPFIYCSDICDETL